MRIGITSNLLAPLKKAGYKIEPAFGAEKDTVVVEIPVDVGANVRTVSEVSMWEQLALASAAQRYWADNQVSCTVTFDPETEGDQLNHALDIYQYQLKGISFLPRLDHGAYPQMPYESIDVETYHSLNNALGKLNFGRIRGEEIVVERFCDNDVCEITEKYTFSNQLVFFPPSLLFVYRNLVISRTFSELPVRLVQCSPLVL